MQPSIVIDALRMMHQERQSNNSESALSAQNHTIVYKQILKGQILLHSRTVLSVSSIQQRVF
jgi:hypothetical protein